MMRLCGTQQGKRKLCAWVRNMPICEFSFWHWYSISFKNKFIRSYEEFHLLGYNAVLCLLPASFWFLIWFILQPCIWRRNISQKRQLILNLVYGVISQKIKIWRTTDVRTSNPTYSWVAGHWVRNTGFTEIIFFSMALPAHSGPRPIIHFRNHFSQTVGLLGRVISPSQGRYLHTGQHKHRINAYTHQTSMPWLGFEPTIPASERTKTVHALDRAATATGLLR
jgi:hypothetical protein